VPCSIVLARVSRTVLADCGWIASRPGIGPPLSPIPLPFGDGRLPASSAAGATSYTAVCPGGAHRPAGLGGTPHGVCPRHARRSGGLLLDRRPDTAVPARNPFHHCQTIEQAIACLRRMLCTSK
jgi:hypothetical protein